MDSQAEELLSDEEAFAAFDAAARHFLNMSGEEFARQWDAGELRGFVHPALTDVAILRPNGR